MNKAREDRSRLASYVVSARIAAGYRDRRMFATATGITERTIGKLETGQRVSPHTLAIVEQFVGWKPDSARMVLEGGEPVFAAVPEPEPEPALNRLDKRERELVEQLAELLIRNREEALRPRPAGSGTGS